MYNFFLTYCIHIFNTVLSNNILHLLHDIMSHHIHIIHSVICNNNTTYLQLLYTLTSHITMHSCTVIISVWTTEVINHVFGPSYILHSITVRLQCQTPSHYPVLLCWLINLIWLIDLIWSWHRWFCCRIQIFP